MNEKDTDGSKTVGDHDAREDDDPFASRRGVLAGIGLGGFAAGVGYRDAIRERFRAVTSDDSDAWEGDADDRIERHRTTTLEVLVVDENDEPIPDAEVEVSMQDHAFDFGTAVNAEYLNADTDAGEAYRSAVTGLFNTAVLENRHKWGFWESPDERGRADAATEWLLARGLELRGHTCIWQKRDQGAIPEDVYDAMDRGDGEYVETRSSDHVWTIVDHYADLAGFTEWDVLNEQVEMHEMTDVIEPETSPTTSQTIVKWFEKAREADPDAQLFINEYDVLVGEAESHRDAFEDVVAHLLENDAPLGGLGLQSHHPSVEHRRTPEELLSTLDRFAEYVPSIKITEYDTWDGEWTEELEAEYLYEFLKTIFSHPAVDGFLMWGIWDEIHWQDNAPLFRDDWSRKPAHDVYTDLVLDQWWTEESGRTDSDGRYRSDAFLGEYELTIRANDRTATTSVYLGDPTTERTVTIAP